VPTMTSTSSRTSASGLIGPMSQRERSSRTLNVSENTSGSTRSSGNRHCHGRSQTARSTAFVFRRCDSRAGCAARAVGSCTGCRGETKGIRKTKGRTGPHVVAAARIPHVYNRLAGSLRIPKVGLRMSPGRPLPTRPIGKRRKRVAWTVKRPGFICTGINRQVRIGC